MWWIIFILYTKNIHCVQYSTSLYLLRVYRTKCRLIKRCKSLFILSANAPLENVRKKDRNAADWALWSLLCHPLPIARGHYPRNFPKCNTVYFYLRIWSAHVRMTACLRRHQKNLFGATRKKRGVKPLLLSPIVDAQSVKGASVRGRKAMTQARR